MNLASKITVPVYIIVVVTAVIVTLFFGFGYLFRGEIERAPIIITDNCST